MKKRGTRLLALLMALALALSLGAAALADESASEGDLAAPEAQEPVVLPEEAPAPVAGDTPEQKAAPEAAPTEEPVVDEPEEPVPETGDTPADEEPEALAVGEVSDEPELEAEALEPMLLTAEEPETDGDGELTANLKASFTSFVIDGNYVLDGVNSGTGSGGGTWDVSVYNIESTSSVVFIELQDFVGESIRIESSTPRYVTVIANGNCVISGYTFAWPGIAYSGDSVSLEIRVNGSLTINDTDIGIAAGNVSYQANAEGAHHSQLTIKGTGTLNIAAGSRGIHSMSGINSGWGADYWFGNVSIEQTQVTISCSDASKGYGILTGGTYSSGEWTSKGLSISDGASVKIQMAEGAHALRHDKVSYTLGEDYVEEGDFYGSYWYVHPGTTEEITRVDVSLTEPAAGIVATYTATSDSTKCTVVDGRVRWQDRADNSYLTDPAYFLVGKTYRAIVWLEENSGYSITNNTEVYFNEQKATRGIKIDNATEFSYDFTCSATTSDACYVVTAGSLNVRADADASSNRLGGLSYGDFIQAKAASGNWVMFDYEGQDAWVNRNYLALTYSEETAIDPTNFTVTATLNVRSDISTESERIGGFKAGDVILATGRRTDGDGNKWLVLDYFGDGEHKLGYVMADYTEGEEAKEDEPDGLLTMTAFPEDLSILDYLGKAVIAAGEYVMITGDNIGKNAEGELIVTVYPDDGDNFTTMTAEDVKLPDGAAFTVRRIIKNTDGSMTIVLAPKAEEITYSFTEGADGDWTKGSTTTLDFTVKGSPDDTQTFANFAGVEVDGAALTSADYTAVSGSVKLSLQPAYLETLAEGSHSVKLSFKDGGSASASFTVKAAAAASGGNASGGSNTGGTTNNNTTTTATNNTTNTATNTTTTVTAPKTGDGENIALWALMLGGCGLGLAAVIGKKRRYEK